jgi:hypothetical protein
MTVARLLIAVCVGLAFGSPAPVAASRARARNRPREFRPLKPLEFDPVNPRHPRRTPLSVALERAYQLWGVEPCGGRYRVELTTLPPDVRGHAAWREPAASLGAFTTPSGIWTDCVIQLPATAWTPEGVASEWPDACSVVLHEWGHLTGHPHSDEPGEPAEPPGMTQERLEVMRSAPPVDLERCGWQP